MHITVQLKCIVIGTGTGIHVAQVVISEGVFIFRQNLKMDEDLGGGGGEDSSDWHSLSEELKNIQNHIRLTKEHIDALNARFAGYQNPPGIFLNEYDELTYKLHKFILREQSLRVREILPYLVYRYRFLNFFLLW
jgi:hypothetical protein